MTKLINKNKLDVFANKLWKRITKSFVSKTLPNTVTGETMITDGYVGGESTITKMHNETRATMNSLNHNTSFYGIPSLSVPARTYVDKIICIMHDSAGDIGTTATGVNVGVVSKSTGKILEYLKTDETETIIANPLTIGSHTLTGDKAISISINKAWQEEVYFIVGAMKMMAGYMNSFAISIGGDELKEVGYNLGNGSTGNYIGRMAIYTSKYSLNEIATKSLSIDDIKNDYVSKTKENVISSKTTLLNGCILNSAISTVNNTNATSVMTDSRFAGSPSLTAGGNVHISYLCVAVDDNYEIGREISGIKIAAVSYDTNRVKEVITTIGKATVCENIYGHIDSRKVILYPIQKSYDVGVYFIVGFHGMKWGSRSNNDWLTAVPNNTFPAVNTSIAVNTSNWIYQAAIFSEETKLNEMLTSINTLSTSKAGISNANTFTNTNTFNGTVGLNENVDIRYVTKYEQPLLGNDRTKGSEWAVYFDRDIYIPAGSYVTYLDIRVTDEASVGTELSNIYIYEVYRGNSIDNDGIVRVSFDNSRFGVSNVDGYGKCIRARLNKKFDRDTYYIIGQREENGKILRGNDNQGNIRRAITTKPFVLNSSHNILSESRPTNDKVIHRYTIERVGILQDDIKNINNELATTVKNTDVGNEANKIPIIGADGRLPSSILPPEQNGGVRMVNGRSPESNGNVTVLAEHIKYANGQDTTTVKGAIDNKPNTVNGQGVNRNNGNITIYSDNIDISSSNSRKISQVLDEKLNKSEVDNSGNKVPRLVDGKLIYDILPNTVVRTDKENVFRTYCPKVKRTFTMASFNVEGSGNRRFEVFRNEVGSIKYVCNYFAKFDNRTTVTHLIVPIKDAVVGDVVSATFFVISNDNRVIRTPGGHINRTVEDIDILGFKCIRIPVNEAFSGRVGFGISVVSKIVNGRRIGMAYANDPGYNSNVWVGDTPENNKLMTTTNGHYVFPFKVGHETTSELVTRFELEKVANIYPRIIGEYRSLSYDAGDVLEEDGYTWIKANGQSISKRDYPELYEKMNTEQATKNLSIDGDIDENTEIILPNIENTIGYYYICAK